MNDHTRKYDEETAEVIAVFEHLGVSVYLGLGALALSVDSFQGFILIGIAFLSTPLWDMVVKAPSYLKKMKIVRRLLLFLIAPLIVLQTLMEVASHLH